MEYVEILFNSVEKCIAVRPCDKDDINAVKWGTIRNGKWVVLPKSCKGFSEPLFDLMNWNDECKYRFRGQYSKENNEQILLFDLEEPEVIKHEIIQEDLPDVNTSEGVKDTENKEDEVIVLSKGVQDYFKETYGRKTHFIPNGVNRPQTREANLITDKFGLKKDSYILFLGRLVPEKGIRYLVEAFKNVKTDKKLVIAGGSSDTDSFMKELKELAKGDDRILFTGFVQGAMLDELYSNAYIYTLPSDLEGIQFDFLCNKKKPGAYDAEIKEM